VCFRYTGDPELLSPPDLLLTRLMAVPRLAGRLRCMLFYSGFGSACRLRPVAGFFLIPLIEFCIPCRLCCRVFMRSCGVPMCGVHVCLCPSVSEVSSLMCSFVTDRCVHLAPVPICPPMFPSVPSITDVSNCRHPPPI
jgi:hypothetical protein